MARGERDFSEVDPKAFGLNVVQPYPYRMNSPFGGGGSPVDRHPSSVGTDIPTNRISSPGEVIFALRIKLDDAANLGIPLGPCTLGKTEIETLIHKLDDPEIDTKIAAAAANDGTSAIQRYLARKLSLITGGQLSGPDAVNQAGRLLDILTLIAENGGAKKVEAAGVIDILTENQLHDAREMVEKTNFEHASVLNQLNSLTLPTTGMTVEVPRTRRQPDEKTLIFVQKMVDVLRKLRHEESGEVLKVWVLNGILTPQKRQETILFLKAAVQISGLIDVDELTRMCGGEFNLLPYESLHRAIDGARNELDKYDSVKDVKDLDTVSQQLYLKYRQIVLSRQKIELRPGDVRKDISYYEDLALNLIAEADDLKLSDEEAAKFIAKVLEQIGTGDFVHFKNQFDIMRPVLGELIHTEAIRRGVVEDGEKQAEITRETYKQLKSYKWRDVAHINFKIATKHNSKEKLIKPQTKVIVCDILTGTFGPFTEGHKSAVKRQLAQLRYMAQFDPPDVQRFLLLSPLTVAKGLREYSKSKPLELRGTLYERVASILLGLADLTDEEKDTILLTTELAPKPGKAKEIDTSVRTLVHKVRQNIQEAYGGVNPVDFIHRLDMGSDEFRDGIPTKARPGINSVNLIVRHGDLIHTIDSAQYLAEETGVETVILTPDSSNVSSSSVKEAIVRKNFYGIPVATRNFLALHWSIEYRGLRRKGKIRDEFPKRFKGAVPSIEFFQDQLLEEYPKITNIGGK